MLFSFPANVEEDIMNLMISNV